MKYIVIIFLSIVMFGCYTDAVDSLSTFTVQVPVFLHGTYENRTAPDTTFDFSNLYEYEEYRDNEDRIQKSEIYQFNYRVDSLVLESGVIYDPNVHDVNFEFIRFYVQFAQPLTSNTQSSDENDFMPDPTQPRYLIGEYIQPNVRDFLKSPDNIITVDDEVSAVISEILKDKPYFYIIAETSRVNGQESYRFDYIESKFDVVIRLEIK